MTLTFTRDPGLRVVDFTEAMRQLDQLQLDDFADYGFDQTALDALRDRFADWPRHEDDDHEGQAIHAAVADAERRMQGPTAAPTAATLAGQAYPSDTTTPPTPDAGSVPPRPPESRSHSRPRS